jgi:hypothetical protein
MTTGQLTAEQLKKFLAYDAATGLFTWTTITTNRVKAGQSAGYVQKRGYIAIGLMGRTWLAHRLAWLYVTGTLPHGQVDHINRNRTDNRFANLRLATNAQNQHNASMRKNNRSGVHGVSWDQKSGKWLAKICINRRQKFLGHFATIEAATEARLAAEKLLQPFRAEPL